MRRGKRQIGKEWLTGVRRALETRDNFRGKTRRGIEVILKLRTELTVLAIQKFRAMQIRTQKIRVMATAA